MENSLILRETFKTEERQSLLKKSCTCEQVSEKQHMKLQIFLLYPLSLYHASQTNYNSPSTQSEWNSKFLAVRNRLGEEKLDQM